MAQSITAHDLERVKRANDSGLQPIVFIHGLWLKPSSWDRWIERFEEAGYAALVPDWPADSSAGLGQIADHYEHLVRELRMQPAIVGHSLGGVLAEMLAGRSASAASVAISPVPLLGVVPLTFEQFCYAVANAVNVREARELYESFAVSAPGEPALTETERRTSGRAPMLVVVGEMDYAVPSGAVRAAFEQKWAADGNVTEFSVLPGRGHSLTIDHGWSEVADAVQNFIERFAPSAVRK